MLYFHYFWLPLVLFIDTDPAITSFAAYNWTSHLGFAIQEDWRPWTVDGCRRIGGYVTRYNGHFDYLTIRGAGHMVCSFSQRGIVVCCCSFPLFVRMTFEG